MTWDSAGVVRSSVVLLAPGPTIRRAAYGNEAHPVIRCISPGIATDDDLITWHESAPADARAFQGGRAGPFDQVPDFFTGTFSHHHLNGRVGIPVQERNDLALQLRYDVHVVGCWK